MSAGLIKHLKHKTEQDPNTAILLAQWEFDEKLVGKALENVSSYYPHFSSHNASHSQQILVNIERLLGDNINELSATDTWLLLESAYWHDIGMLFNTDEVQEVLKDSNFLDYVESLALDNSQDLHEFAKTFHDEGWEKALVKYDHPHTGIEKYRQMVAEWFRRGHPSNSQKVVEDPFKKLGINSPRTELLPNRIYRYLGQICLSHGIGFEQVMSDLPYRQTGMGTENCHPRYVACLLRLGDLFDIDDNRFCPVMAKQVANMPDLSQHHADKHQAIREFQLDSESISITAECQTQESYIQSQNWFGWIKEEIQNQMAQWKNIVPSRNFGLLPTINKLEVVMDSPKILLDNKPMKFSLDEKSAIELLQGRNLYDNKVNIFREIIQNAIDTTMIRAWVEHGKNSNDEIIKSYMNPHHNIVKEVLNKYPISIDLVKIEDSKDDEDSLWQLTIQDSGMGISIEDLRHIQKISSSNKNKDKKRIIKTMPAWMKPSGEFGIGIHSAFLLMESLPVEKQKLIFKTKSKVDNKTYKIELCSPISSKNGYCFIEEKPNDLSQDYGSKLKINLPLSKVQYHLHNFGFEVHDKFNRLEGCVSDYINAHYYIEEITKRIVPLSPVTINFHERWNEFNQELKNNNTKNIWLKNYNLFVYSQNIKETSLTSLSTHCFGYFRGQQVEHLNISFLPFSLDFWGFNARDVLQIDRNKWQKDYFNKLYDDNYFEKVFIDLVDNHTSKMLDIFNDAKVLSAYNRMYGFKSYKFNNDNWKNLILFESNKTIYGNKVLNKSTFKQLLSLEKFNIEFDRNHHLNANKKSVGKNTIYTTTHEDSFFITLFISEWYENGGYHKIKKEQNKTIIKFRKTISALDNSLELYLKGLLRGRKVLFIDSEKVENLKELKPFSNLVCLSSLHKNYFSTSSLGLEQSLLLPFTSFKDSDETVISLKSLDSIIEAVWQVKQQTDPTITKNHIKTQYQELIDVINKKMEVIPEWKKSLERGHHLKHFDISVFEKYQN